jgi:diacylglycerol kinase
MGVYRLVPLLGQGLPCYRLAGFGQIPLASLGKILFASFEDGPISTATEQQVIDRSQVKARPSRTLIPNAWQKKTGRATNMIESFYHAFHGIWIGLKEERNVRIHFCSMIAVIIAGLYLKVDAVGWIGLFLAIGLVLTTEFLNTSLEHLVNLSAEGQYYESARYAKDTAAAAVLCASFMALVVGLIVFVPRVFALLH